MSVYDLRTDKSEDLPLSEQVDTFEPLMGLRLSDGRLDMDPTEAEREDMDDDEAFWHDCQTGRFV